jgi:hypothetical protein
VSKKVRQYYVTFRDRWAREEGVDRGRLSMVVGATSESEAIGLAKRSGGLENVRIHKRATANIQSAIDSYERKRRHLK